MRLGFDGGFNLGQENISVAKRNLLNSDELLRLDTSKLITLVRGQKPVILDKFYYLDHPFAKNLQVEQITDYNVEPLTQETVIKNIPKEKKLVVSKQEESNEDPLGTTF